MLKVCTCFLLRGNPTYQGIWSWIIHIFHYHCRKQCKNIENPWIMFSFCLSLCLMWLALPVAFLKGRIWNVASDHLCHIYFRFLVENGFLQLEPTWCHCLHLKNCVYNNFSSCYFMSSITIERLYKSFSFINSSAQINLELEILQS